MVHYANVDSMANYLQYNYIYIYLKYNAQITVNITAK